MNCRKVLIAVDGSENAGRAVEYVGDMLRGTAAEQVKLLHIERCPSRDLYEDEAAWKEACTAVRGNMGVILERARDTLVSKGIPQEVIDTASITSCHSPLTDPATGYCSPGTSIAQDILSVLEEEGFGTVVVGRRGVSKAEEFLFGSVSNKVVHHAHGCTVWVVS